MQCTRCGAEAHDYGSDGLAYCSSCLFYGMNTPCWKCRMYLPASELQTYRGQLTCQYCMMDLKDEQRRMEERGSETRKDHYVSEEIIEEHCDRCGRELRTVYYYNGKHLCSTCLEEEKKEWKTVGGEGPPMSMYKVKEEKSRKAKIVEAVHRKLNEFFGFVVKKFVKEEEEKSEKKRKELEKARIEEKIGPAKDKLLIEQIETPKQKIAQYNIETPDKLPKKKRKKKEENAVAYLLAKKNDKNKKEKGKKLGFENLVQKKEI